ncbi:MAG: hypothetical protein B6I32_07695 [Desulfobacterium sp. 4572_20]|nr:DUF4911 domain-containing protein [Deltaproteobacteria bacterium]MCD6265440.1 DUF4911 domain-containing protein [Deltaproteobacteria bacterium]OQY15316.1 MAG: hypothetical protein B6I32_07695 [Desulfobacterium sp. 4572_20]RLB20930.1 MAG: hypothetical protein DRG73_09380 [Deltaproteobacteria bacterium]HDH88430.1 DUF4911 domain-containing protein [Desulfobacteraceae bacterium]
MRQTGKYLLSIDRKEICYLQWIIESYDGMASMRTINPINGEIEISIAPCCREDILSLIKSLQEEGSIHINKEKLY